MCGRFLGFDTYNDNELHLLIDELFKKANENNITYTIKTEGEIFPGDIVPVIVKKDNKLIMHPMKWGFVSKDNKLLINTRSETINDLSTWKEVIKTNRCIIPSNGFYEWNKKSGQKNKYMFNVNKEKSLYMVGVYKIFSLDNKRLVHFSIITTSSNKYINDVHDRMPIIINRNEFNLWLGDNYETLLNKSSIILERKLV